MKKTGKTIETNTYFFVSTSDPMLFVCRLFMTGICWVLGSSRPCSGTFDILMSPNLPWETWDTREVPREGRSCWSEVTEVIGPVILQRLVTTLQPTMCASLSVISMLVEVF